MKSDHELLKAYAESQSEDAFAELVRRYAGAVYASALRQTGEPHAAQEISQTVFILLSRKARSITPSVVLIGWLMNATRFACRDRRKLEHRRRARETAAFEQAAHTDATDPHAIDAWREIQPAVDEAIAALPEPDRNALWLRFFQNKPLREVAQALGIADDAARKRVARALDRVQAQLAKRGIHSPASALPAAFAQASVTLPDGLIEATLRAAATPSPALEALSQAVAAQLTLASIKASIGTLAACLALLIVSGVSLERHFDPPAPLTQTGLLSDYRPAGFDDPQVVHQFAARLRDAAVAGDRTTVAALCRFPLRVNLAGNTVWIPDASELTRQFDRIFTASVCAILLKSPLEGLFSNVEGVMIGDGTLWIAPVPNSKQPVQPELIAINVNR